MTAVPVLARLALAAAIALALASYFRFEIVTGRAGVYRLDRLTGQIGACVPVTVYRFACTQDEYSQDVKK